MVPHWFMAVPAIIIRNVLMIVLLSLPAAAKAGVGSGPVLSGDNFYYTFDNGKIIVYKVPGKYLVEYPNGLYSNPNSSGAPNYPPGMMQPHNRFLVTDTCNLDAYGPNHFVTPAYRTVGGKPFYYAKEIVLRFHANVSAAEKAGIIGANNLTLARSSLTFEVYKVQGDAFAVAKAIYETGKVRFCHPDFLAQIDKFYEPNDPYFIKQWYLYNRNPSQEVNGKTGTPGADINVVPAWDITKGSANVVVAVIDEGITPNHPDLPNSRQVRLPGSNFAYLYDGTNDPDNPSPTVSTTVPYNHGNAVAGIIAATQDNNEGISGIAPHCRIMPVKIILGNDEFGNPYPVASIAADAINFAVNNGANIISCSWGTGGSSNEFPTIVDAIENALMNNVTVLFAIGNNAEHEFSGFDDGISFPANNNTLIKLGMITVGASTRADKQANYSPYGDNISVVAPSHSYNWEVPPGEYPIFAGEGYNIWTIDIPGDEGYNPWKHLPGTTNSHVYNPNSPPGVHNDEGVVYPNSGTNHLAYTAYFGGTSAATPEVAGVAALMLSVNSCLGNAQIKDLLQSTAAKIGGYNYNQNPARGGQSKELGYGKIDAHKAVLAAQAVQSSTLDLFIKDNPNDIGIVGAAGTGGGSDQCPDIWVRNQVHETPEYQVNTPVYAYVKVHNKSCVTSSGTELLRLYWHYASACGTGWPGGWDGTGPLINNMAQGGPVGEAFIPVLQPGEETIVTFEWWMDPALTDAPNACLLARIENVAADPITEYPVGETHLMISQNNNVAIKNITVMNVQEGFAPAPGFLRVFNESWFSRSYNLQIRVPGWGDGFANDITKEAEVRIQFDDAGWNMLHTSGSLANEGIRSGGEREIILNSPDVTLSNLSFPAGASMQMQVRFNFLTKEYTDNRTYQLAFSTTPADDPGETLGTETFIVHKYSRDMFDANAGDDKMAYPQESVYLSAQDIGEPALYNWYDTEGNLVYTGKNWTVDADVTKKYKLEVISLIDGFKDYDEVKVDVKQNYLTGIAPNPAGAQTTIGYHTEGASSAYLVLVRPFSNTAYNYILNTDQTSYQLNTSELPMGVYNVILVCDGVISDAKSLQVN